jgi:hypothetical protein
MFEYFHYLIEKFLDFFGKNREDKTNLKKLIINNKKFLSTIVNINVEYTTEELLKILKHELNKLNLDMNSSIEVVELKFEDIEKRTFLHDIIDKIGDLNE